MAITVPVVNTPLSVSGFGKPVADQLNAITPTSWANITLTAPWVAMAAPHPPTRYAKLNSNTLILQVACSGGTSGVVIGTLPAGFRPTYAGTFLVRGGGSPPAIIIQVNPDGTIVPYFPTGATGDICAGVNTIPLN